MMKPMLIKKIWTTFLIPTYSVLLSPNIRIDRSGGATELENGPNNVLQSKEYSLAGTRQGCILCSCQHFLWNLSKALKYIWV